MTRQKCLLGAIPLREVFAMSNQANVAGVLPHPELVALARRRVDRDGIVRASQALGLARESLMRIASGMRVRRGTLVLACQSLGWSGPGQPPNGPGQGPKREELSPGLAKATAAAPPENRSAAPKGQRNVG